MSRQPWMIVGVLSSLMLSACSAPRPIETVRASADHRYIFGDYAGAQEEYAEIVSRQPGDWEAQYKLGQCMLKTGELAGARRALEVAHTLKPHFPEVTKALAEAMFQQNDEEHLYAFLREHASSTRSVDSYLMHAHYAMELGDPDSAQTALETAIRIDAGTTTEPYLEAARLAERLGQLDQAVHRLRQAYGINPKDRRVLLRLRALGEDPTRITAAPPG